MRIGFAELPEAARVAVEARTGPVRAVEPTTDGGPGRMASVLMTRTGRIFVKGVPVGHEEGVAGHAVEAAVNRWALAAAPRLHWQVRAGGWDVLGFRALDGRPADLGPGSPDVRLLAEALERCGRPLPPGFPVPTLAERLGAAGATAAALAGDALLHTDPGPDTLVVAQDRGWIVGWARAARGPAWADTAFAAARLMEHGWTAGDALAWAAAFPAWREAPGTAVEAFVTAVCAWRERTLGADGARAGNGWYAALLDGATEAGAPAVSEV
jgi:hypothetical protein